MNKQRKYLRNSIAAAVALGLGGAMYANFAQPELSGTRSVGTTNDARNNDSSDPNARRARLRWLSSVTPPKGHAPADAQSISQAASDPNMLILQSGLFDPLDARGNSPNPDVSVSKQYAIVQFAEGTRMARETLEHSGATILGYVPNNAYLVRADNSGGIDSLQGLDGVRWAGGYRSDMKLAPSLLNQARDGERGSDDSSDLELSLFHRGLAKRTAQALSAQIPGAIITQVFDEALSSAVRIRVANKMLAQAISIASQIDTVQYIAEQAHPHDLNAATITVLQGNTPANSQDPPGSSNTLSGATPLWAQGLIGNGQIIGVLDGASGMVDQDEAWFSYYGNGDAGKVARVTPTFNVSKPDDGQELAPGPLHPQNKVIGMWKPSSMTAIGAHATHVAGILAGDLGGKYGTAQYATSSTSEAGHDLADGNAPNSQLLYQSLGMIVDDYPLDKILRQAHAGGARVHNNSWGDAFDGSYGSWSREADIATYQRDDLLVIAAAGNSGDDSANCPSGQWRGSRCWRSVGSPGSAKNILTVAATKHGPSLNVDSYSSRGVLDGRFKPDIVAPGTDVISAAHQAQKNVNSSSYRPKSVPMSGTSMASPAITASAALVRQYFTDGFYPSGQRNAADQFAPSSAVLKAALLNSTIPARDPVNASSSINTGSTDWPISGGGWGRPWLDSNLWFKQTTLGGNDKRRLRLFERDNASGLRSGERHEYQITNVRAGEELRITLTWTDPPATIGAALVLVNNLDLEVEAPDGRIYRGNQLLAGVSKPDATTADVLNNVEQVRLTAPVAGRYLLRIKGKAVPGGGSALAGSDRQGYALVASGAFGPTANATALAAPGGVGVASRSAAGISVQFDAVVDATGYQLYRIHSGCPTGDAAKAYRLVAHQSGSATGLTDALAAAGSSYGYAVRAIGADVEGQLSACVNAVASN